MIQVKTSGDQQVELLDSTGKSTIFNINEELMVNINNYQQEFLDQARKYSFWSDKLTIAHRQVSGASQKVDLLHAELYSKAYLNLAKTKMRPTKDLVEASILQDKEYQKALDDVTQYTFVENQLKFIVKAFEQRKDMLIQYGAEMRKDKDIGV
jgi:hypothetical protein